MVPQFLLFLLLVTAGSDPAARCSCIGPVPISDQIDRADLIFEGFVVGANTYPRKEAVKYVGPESQSLFFGMNQYVFFAATKVWKGSRLHDLVVSTARSESACGYPFEEGRKYLVYAYVDEAQTSTNLCTRTASIEEATQDIEVLAATFD